MNTETQTVTPQSELVGTATEAAPVVKKQRAKKASTKSATDMSALVDPDTEVGRAVISALKRAIGGDTHGAAAKSEIQKPVVPRKPRAPAKVSAEERTRRKKIGESASDVAADWKALPADSPIRIDIEARAKQIRDEFEAKFGRGKDKPKCPINKFRLFMKEAKKISPDKAWKPISRKAQAQAQAQETQTQAVSSAAE